MTIFSKHLGGMAPLVPLATPMVERFSRCCQQGHGKPRFGDNGLKSPLVSVEMMVENAEAMEPELKFQAPAPGI